jgi:hypothetical protein
MVVPLSDLQLIASATLKNAAGNQPLSADERRRLTDIVNNGFSQESFVPAGAPDAPPKRPDTPDHSGREGKST